MTNKKIFEFIEQMKNTSDINSVIAKFEKENGVIEGAIRPDVNVKPTRKK